MLQTTTLSLLANSLLGYHFGTLDVTLHDVILDLLLLHDCLGGCLGGVLVNHLGLHLQLHGYVK